MFPKEPYVVSEEGAEPDEPWARRHFFRRVFSLVSLQLAIMAVYVSVGLWLRDFTKVFREKNNLDLGSILWISLTTLLIAFWRRRGCFGIVLLIFQTLSLAALAAYFAVDCSKWTVLLAASSTAVITLMFICISASTNLDITKYHNFVVVFLFIGISCVVILYLLKRIKPDIRAYELSFGIIGSLVFSVLLLYDVQTIVGGNRLIAVKPDNVIYATAQLYMAIGLIFVCLMMLKFV